MSRILYGLRAGPCIQPLRKWRRGEGINGDEGRRGSILDKAVDFPILLCMSWASPSEALNSGDALGFWQKVLAAATGWVEVGSSCRWRAPRKAL